MSLPVFNLDKLQAVSGVSLTYHHLSDISRALCLSLLDGLPSERWTWLNNGQKLTDSEWDTAQAMVALATEELIKTMLTGAILQWPFLSPPAGFMLCDGSEISRDDNLGQLLVSEGCPYGVGDGSTTVNLPDLCGRAPVGLDATQTEFDALGETGGEKTHTLTTGEMPGHSHPHSHAEGVATPVFINGGIEAPAPASLPGIGATGGDSTSAGGSEAHNNLQPYLTLNFIIKT